MWKIFSKLFASDKVVDSGISLIDKAFYTDEEKAEDKQRASDRKDQLLIDWIEASKGSNIARRFIAVLVTLLWVFLFVFGWAVSQYAIWSEKLTIEKLKLIQEANAPYLEQATGAMMLVLGFYFAAPFMGDIAKGALSRFSGKDKS
jgi:hypothetical protein